MHTFKPLTAALFISLGLGACKKEDTPPPAPVDYHQNAPTKFVDVNGSKHAYRELGASSGTPVLMVAPLGSNMDDWDPAITNGLAQQYKVILFDIQGVGASTGTTPNNIADMAKDVTGFIKALGIPKVNLLGFSLGSFISQQIALTEPALVNKIILTGTGPKGATGLSNLPALLAAGANLSAEDNFLRFGFTKSEQSIQAGKASWLRVQQRTQNRDAAITNESFSAAVQAVLGWAQPNPDALNELKTVKQPVLIAQGKEDLPVPVQNAVNMSQNFPNATLIVYPDAAHAALFQHTDDFVKRTSAFLAQ
ncbi:alpha/beta hydrolase [Chitinophaga pendula]|uniref:alpha/beta fold hydrolase n=1 Tax=Chitinophaga TaxID=79328 RepID=UPI000BAF69F1|nr:MULTISPECIES: alpha/beta hydrolase [Chitinophaga]ASZ11388.1 alpha/beta hydrolase [Chitinophaga sp. MD30]UCJ05608.1 alpha/beta hydrolase [Chitinophaga pendula]